ncbi:MAG TPA: DNA gyrase inhibitor YacG [Rhizorhapis sp.]|nr:DNA gyrase inhibitor YacG [Rhizorhapis sp.]
MSPKAAKCPVCGRPAQAETRPFCGKACRDRDLLQWLGEGYRVPGAPASDAMQKNDDHGVDSTPD